MNILLVLVAPVNRPGDYNSVLLLLGLSNASFLLVTEIEGV